MSDVEKKDGLSRQDMPAEWDYTADIIVVGAGTTGLPAAIEAAEHGATVIAIDQNTDVGGYGMISSGSVLTGGGTRTQKENGVEDSPDLRYRDLIDHRHAQTKKNDRALARAFADLCVESTEWLEKHGVKFILNKKYFPPYTYGSVERGHAAQWKEEEQTARCPNKQMVWAGTTIREDVVAPKDIEIIKSTGAGLMRPLEESARKMKEIKILLEHKLTRIMREEHLGGDVVGIEANLNGKKVYLKARKAVILACGGPKGNIDLRRLWDPRLTDIYQADGEPWAFHTGEGIIEAQRIGAQLTGDYGNDIHWTRMRSTVGARWHSVSSYIVKLRTGQDTPGFAIRDPHNAIHVNMEGKRFFSEVPVPWDKQVAYVDAAMANGGGPIWSIFDAEAVKRERLDPAFPTAQKDYFHRAETIADLAARIEVSAAALEEAVNRYNSFVDKGEDEDFGKPSPRFKIQSAPFYAAWATPFLHDTRGGLRVDDTWKVLDIDGKVIPRLYAGGETSGGLDLCGLSKCVVSGRVAARNAVAEKARA